LEEKKKNVSGESRKAKSPNESKCPLLGVNWAQKKKGKTERGDPRSFLVKNCGSHVGGETDCAVDDRDIGRVKNRSYQKKRKNA